MSLTREDILASADAADAAHRCGVCGAPGDHGARRAEIEGRDPRCPTGLTRAQAREPLRDRQGDVWMLGHDGLMHTPETTPFPLHYVHKKWGPLTPLEPGTERYRARLLRNLRGDS